MKLKINDRVSFITECGKVMNQGYVIDITEHNVLIGYTRYGKSTGLRECFNVSYFFDPNKGRIHLRKNKKNYPIILGECDISFKIAGWI